MGRSLCARGDEGAPSAAATDDRREHGEHDQRSAGLFRLTFERIPAEVPSSVANEASRASYDALATRIGRAQEAGVIDDRPEEEIAFAFHACCLGLATSELSREAPPVGSNFWQRVSGIDDEQLWRGALSALIAGLAP